MPPLNRQDTRPSVYSWWSDSNPGLKGPTINIHAVAKPLMKRMYHRQALKFIRENRDRPLSTTTLETYSSYLPWNYVSPSTKDAILEDLSSRSASEADACALVKSPFVFNYITQMLGSPDVGAQIYSCKLLGELARHKSTTSAILEASICERLVSLLLDGETGVVAWAVFTLSQIARWLDGAQAIVDAKALDHVVELLESSSPNIREETCELVGRLAIHGPTASAVLELQLCLRLVPLLCFEDSGIIAKATYALSQIAHWTDGAQAILDAKILEHVLISPMPGVSPHKVSDYERPLLKILGSLRSTVREWACELIGRLASHNSTAPAIFELELKPFTRLVSLLQEEDSLVVARAAYALSQIAHWPAGAGVVIESMALDRILTNSSAEDYKSPILMLLESPSSDIREWVCALVGRLSGHDFTAPAILQMKPYTQLVSLLSDEDSGVLEWATYTMSQIAHRVDGTQAVVDAGVLDRVLVLLQSPNQNIRAHSCELVGRISSQSTVPVTLELNLCKQLVRLLGDRDPRVVEWATYALSEVSQRLDHDGAQTIINTKVLENVLELLESPSPEIRKWTCCLVGRLANQSTGPAILTLRVYEQLVSLLADGNSEVTEWATYALSEISKWSEGAHTLVDAKVQDNVLVLFESSSPDIRKWTCRLVGRLASHRSTVATVLELDPCKQLAFLLGDNDHGVIVWATYALSQISSQLSEGAQAAFDTEILRQLLLLLESPRQEVRNRASHLVEHLAGSESIALVLAIVGLKPSEQLVFCRREPETKSTFNCGWRDNCIWSHLL
ncbi:hypothetical protein MVEN_01354100 [Mycena venus]|uniref:ARM repeat-containing protein n=1 Tax=Mycena venus TaxID=2733690 RepID=A0A8H7CU88_9AGAR|nr:hypothetical protein MVEN_01354100 [Mycena venus]